MSNAEIRGQFVWHELMTSDTDGAIDFYTNVVPWKTQDSGMPSYTLWMSGKYRAGGLMALPEDDSSGTPPHWLVYIGTPDVDATVEAAEGLGGKVLKEAADIPNVGRFAVLADPQGAAFAVFTPLPTSDEVPPGGEVGDFTWHELTTTDLDAALSFYTELFGWSKGAALDMGEEGIYQIIAVDGKDAGGIYKVRDNSTPPSWLSYVRVPDASKAAAAIKANDGRILKGPLEVPGGSWVVMLLDPQGGAFAVVEAPKVAGQQAADDEAATSPPARKKAAKKKAPAGEPATAAAKSAPAKKAPAKSAPAKSSAAKKKAAGKKTPAKAAPAKKTVAKKAPAKKVPAKKTAAKKGAAKKAPAKKAATKSAGKKVAKKTAAKQAAPKKGGKAKRKK